MNAAVRYLSRSGNTKKVADAIAEAIGVSAKSVTQEEVNDDIDVLFLGGAIYGGKIDANLESFIQNLNTNIKLAAVFSTSMAGKNPNCEIAKLLKQKGIEVASEQFHCKGKFLIFNLKNPDKQDLSAAKDFAKNIVMNFDK